MGIPRPFGHVALMAHPNTAFSLQAVLCAGPLVKALLASGAHNYVEFRALSSRCALGISKKGRETTGTSYETSSESNTGARNSVEFWGAVQQVGFWSTRCCAGNAQIELAVRQLLLSIWLAKAANDGMGLRAFSVPRNHRSSVHPAVQSSQFFVGSIPPHSPRTI